MKHIHWTISSSLLLNSTYYFLIIKAIYDHLNIFLRVYYIYIVFRYGVIPNFSVFVNEVLINIDQHESL